MDAKHMIEVARAMRKLGATRLDVRADGFSADFAASPAKPEKRVATQGALDFDGDSEPGIIVNDLRKLSTERLQQLWEDRLREYEPGQ